MFCQKTSAKNRIVIVLENRVSCFETTVCHTCSFSLVPKIVVLSSLKQSILLAMLHLFARYLPIYYGDIFLYDLNFANVTFSQSY